MSDRLTTDSADDWLTQRLNGVVKKQTKTDIDRVKLLYKYICPSLIDDDKILYAPSSTQITIK